MAQLPIDEALNRFKDNETRFDDFVNGAEGYTTSGGTPVESIPAFLERVESEINATDAIAITEANKTAAAASATAAAGSASTASTGATNATNAKTAAETARDAAIAAAAGVSAGGVVGKATKALLDADLAHPADTVGYVTNDTTAANNGLYRKTGASGAGSWVASSFDRVALVEDRATALEKIPFFNPGVNSVLRNVESLRLFGNNAQKFYHVSNFFYNDAGNRFNFVVVESDDINGTNARDVAKFQTGSEVSSYSGLKEFSLISLNSSGITGTLVINFTTAPANWGVYAATYATTGINALAFESSTAATAFIDSKIDTKLNANSLLTSGLKIPFADEMTTELLRKCVKEIWMYGCDPTHNYIINGFSVEQFAGLPLTRFLFTIHDLTSALDVCQYSFSIASASETVSQFAAMVPKQVKLSDAAIANKSNIYAVVTLDLSQYPSFSANAYTTMIQAGINKKRTLADEQISDYLQREIWHERISVGAGQTYTTLRAAVESLHISPADKTCNRSHYNNQILIDLIDDGTYNSTLLEIPEFVSVRGNGVDRTFIVKENNNNDEIIAAPNETKFLDCTIISDTGDGGSWTGEYCIHSDDINRKSRPEGKQQNRRLRQLFKRMKLIAGENQNTWIFGCGISSGQTIKFEDVIAEHLNPNVSTAAFGFHNTGPTLSVPAVPSSYKPFLVEMSGCRSPDNTTYGVYLQTLEPTAVGRLVLNNCDFNLVFQTVAGPSGEVVTDKAKARFGWEIGGVHSGPILQTDPEGMIVLATAPGAAVSGTAAAVIFGTIDELGRGDLWVKTGTTKSLGARLGDCSTVNKTLTIAGQSHVFNTNLTASSNATIIAAINASITTNPVSEKDIQTEIYPDTGFTRRMLNSTGATISAGRFVKQTGAKTIALANGTDDIYGFVYRDILNGKTGNVVTVKKIHTAYFNSAASNGKFGITNGVVDYANTTYKGFVIDGIATLY